MCLAYQAIQNRTIQPASPLAASLYIPAPINTDGWGYVEEIQYGTVTYDTANEINQNPIMGYGKGTDSNTLIFEVPKNFKPNSKFGVSEEDKEQLKHLVFT